MSDRSGLRHTKKSSPSTCPPPSRALLVVHGDERTLGRLALALGLLGDP